MTVAYLLLYHRHSPTPKTYYIVYVFNDYLYTAMTWGLSYYIIIQEQNTEHVITTGSPVPIWRCESV